MAIPDPELAQFVASGDAEAFGCLVSRHLDMVYATAGRRLGQYGHLAADVAQAVFTRLAQQAKALPPEIVLGAWLHRQTVRLAIDTVRQENRRRAREAQAQLLASMNEPDPLWTALGPELDEALDRLSSSDREVLVLRYLEGRSLRETGELLGLEPNTTQKRASRALERLRSLLERRGIAFPTTTATSGLALLMTEKTLQAAPLTLHASLPAASLQAASLAGGGGASFSFLTTFLMSHAISTGLGAAAAVILAALWHFSTPPNPATIPLSTTVGDTQRKPTLPPSLGRKMPANRALTTVNAPQTIPEIIAAIAEMANRPLTRRQQLECEALLEKIAPEDYETFIKLLDAQVAEPLREKALSWACNQWQKKAPGSLVSALVASDAERVGGNKRTQLNCLWGENTGNGGANYRPWLRNAFSAWLAADSALALQWLVEQKGHPTLTYKMSGKFLGSPESLLHVLFANSVGWLMKKNPSNIGAFLANWPDHHLKSLLSSDSFENDRFIEDAVRSKRPAIFDFLSEADGQPAYAELAAKKWSEAWSREHPEECRKWIIERAGSPLAYLVAKGYLSSDRKTERTESSMSSNGLLGSERMERADFFVTQAPPDKTRPAVLKDAVQAWGTSDAAIARQWLYSRSHSGEGDEAWLWGARNLATTGYKPKDDLPEALRWATSARNVEQARPIVRGIMRQWLDKEPEAAQAFPNKENWPAATVDLVRDLISTP